MTPQRKDNILVVIVILCSIIGIYLNSIGFLVGSSICVVIGLFISCILMSETIELINKRNL